jgi:ATP-dependent Clp endopeptidase proteolytic subunit ClpP
MTGYSIVAKTKEAEITLYSEIGDSWWGGISAKQFAEDLKSYGKIERITVRINSPGGDVFDGITIYNVLKQHQAKVTVYIDGLAASIASIIAMAGDEIYMAENAFMMIHDAWTIALGSANDLRETADRLEKVNESILATYAKRASIKEDEIRGLMADETWMTAQEAMNRGFVDSIVESLDMAASANFNLEKFKYKKAPNISASAVEAKLEAVSDIEAREPEPQIDTSFFDNAISKLDTALERLDRVLARVKTQ